MKNYEELSNSRMMILSFANEVLLMQEEIDRLRRTNEHLEKIRDKYL